MAKRRELLLPADAKTEGERLLRELLRKQPYAQLARRLRCTEAAVRHYARGRVPDPRMRSRMQEVFGWKEDVWSMKPDLDVYAAGDEPETRRDEKLAARPPPTTRQRPKA